MTKEFKDWLDEFVDNGANPKDVTNWPEEAGGTVELQDKTVSPTTIRQEIIADENYDGLGKVTINAVTNAIDENIVSGNIKKDVSILGVTGTYEGGGGTTGVTYTCEYISTQLPRTVFNMGVATVGSNVYIFGGYNSNGRVRVNTIYKFNVDTETITRLSTTLPYELTNTGAAAVGSNIYLFGGNNASGSYGDVDVICKFNTETETITRLSTKLTANTDSLRAAAVGSKVYLFGGNSTYTTDKTTIEKFTVDF